MALACAGTPLLLLAALLSVSAANQFSALDLISAQVWLDKHVFNNTLAAESSALGFQRFVMQESKARAQGLPWPVDWPTLCFLGLGPASSDLFMALTRILPELQVVLIDVEQGEHTAAVAEQLGVEEHRLARASIRDFAEENGPARRRCDAVQWSLDTPSFSFYRYRELFYSTPFVLSMLNMQGCYAPWELKGKPTDRYYCEYLYGNFKATLCGKVDENNFWRVNGQDLYFPTIEAGCGEHICMCHGHSDTFIDSNLEHLCRKGEEPHFMGQWGQDRFLVENVFGEAPGLYVDVGTSHPFHLSNTAFLDSCLGWRGVCLEPNPRLHHVLRGLRTCSVVNACAWANETSFKFSNDMELAARTSIEDLKPSRPGEIPADLHPSETFFEARCAPLHDLLQEGLVYVLKPEEVHAAASGEWKPRIDLLSVDAEGAELEIFADFPFEAWDIRCIVIETSRRTSMAIDSLLLPLGFVKVAILGKDAVYLSQSQMSNFPSGSHLRLPERILWNAPGSDSDTIEYRRFQRMFGLDGDLDVDVGDQGLLNETELLRQAERQEAKNQQSYAEALGVVADTSLGGRLTAEQREKLDEPQVKEILSDPLVRRAMRLLTNHDRDGFLTELRSNERLASHMRYLCDAEVFGRAEVCSFDL